MTAPLELPDAVLRDAVPDDDIVVAYVTRGALARYVEGVAERNPKFRDELEACIDGLEEAGEPVSATARAWRRPGVVTKPQRRWLAYAPLALAAAVCLFAGNAYWSAEQESARIQALKDEEIARKNAEIEKLLADLEAQQESMALAQSELARAKSDSDRSLAMAKLAEAQEQQRKTQAAITAVKGAGAAKAGAKPACKCQPGDPLCSCL